MQIIFNDFIESYISNKVGKVDNFISKELASNLKLNLLRLYSQNQFKAAGIGNQNNHAHNLNFRSDSIFWLDRKHQDPFENEFFDRIDLFVSYLNQTCYTNIQDYEFHYAYYAEGAFYKKHVDQFQNETHRAFSMIIYLNSEWLEGDGGELCIHHQDMQEVILPIQGKSVFFKSDELAHEVLKTLKPRLSIVGWLKTN